MLFRDVENEGLDCRVFGFIVDFEDENKFQDRIDGYLTKLGEKRAEMEIPIGKIHIDGDEQPHPGVISSLVQSVMLIPLKTIDQVGRVKKVSIDYLEEVKMRDTLTAKGSIEEKEGKIESIVKVYNQHNVLVAEAVGELEVQGAFLAPYIERLRKEGKF